MPDEANAGSASQITQANASDVGKATLVCDEVLQDVARKIAGAGGSAVLVGGYVRDALLGLRPKDIDIEVFGLDAEALTRTLSSLGPVKRFGASFAVQQVRGLPIDFSLPRADTFAEAARFRDLTINSMGRDILRHALIDPFGGVDDLRAGRLRATDAVTFGEDPLRALRVCQIAARFEMMPDVALVALCAKQDLQVIAGERLRHEFHKLLNMARKPSVGLRIFRDARLARFFPALVDVDDALVDEAASLVAQAGRESLLTAALLYRASLEDARAWLERTRAPNALAHTTLTLLRHAHEHAPQAHPRDLAAWMQARAARLASVDVVLGRHLIARGFHPGVEMGRILQACRALQDDTGETDAHKILLAVLGQDVKKSDR